MPNHTVYLSTGSNIGDRKNNLDTVLNRIDNQIGTVVKQSNIYETEAWGKEDQQGFLNQILCIETDFSPDGLLSQIHSIESAMGRVRKDKWAARTIDIDILFYEDQIINKPNLIIPHPHIQDRNFILVPFLELAPEFIHPKLNHSIRELYFSCTDKLKVFLN